jgi:engulfment/cell motility protein 1
MLINSLLAHATDTWWEDFISQLERLNTRKAIIVSPVVPCAATRTDGITQRLMSSHTVEDLTSCVLDFQGNMARVIYRKKTTLVQPDVEETHAAALDYIWTNSRLQAEMAPDGTTLKWRQLGFASENLSHEFTEVGVLGLDCLVSSALWHKVVPLTCYVKEKSCANRSRLLLEGGAGAKLSVATAAVSSRTCIERGR